MGWTGPDRSHRENARGRLAGNPFYVLELRPDCSRAEIEREGQKLLGMLELELAAARTYRSPIGEHRRTPELVREAMAELRDPNRRLIHELWATLDPTAAQPAPSDPIPAADASERANLDPYPALHALGFGHWSRR
jgi:hypothetical protein